MGPAASREPDSYTASGAASGRSPFIGAVALTVWFALVLWVTQFAPPSRDTMRLVGDLFLFRGPDPWLDATFSMMGIWPLLYGRVFWRERGRVMWSLPLLGMAFGAFVLLPGVALRRYGWVDVGGRLLWFCRSPKVGWGLSLAMLGLGGYGVVFGDLATAIAWWRRDGFVHIYLLDFCALTAVYPFLLLAEARRIQKPKS